MANQSSLLPQSAIEEFRQLYFAKYHIQLDLQEAERKAENFIRLMALITNTNHKND